MIRRLVVGLIRVYRAAISPLLPASCRFVPSCSEYALRAVGRHGAWRGGWLALRRLLRCHPFGGHGYDPVPGAGPSGAAADRGIARPPDARTPGAGDTRGTGG